MSERERNITSIFHSAIEREPYERGPYLDDVCAGDEALRHEVEQLIKSHASAGSFIDAPAYERGAELLEVDAPQRRAGQSIGPYKIISLLGAGGMGEVYRAHDARLGREVALKLLPDSLAGGTEGVRRFQQEARAASALNHPNILAIYDIGEHDGSPYIVSELLEGETLREKFGGVPLATRKALDYALQTARGLATAHDKGIVHRDLKPENLFVTKDGRVKILDFGIAKLVQRNAAGGELHTEAPTLMVQTNPGMVVGTAGYMSPEQVRGQKVDTRSDIFSFGAILYEALSGRRAFHGESPFETMNAILKEDPTELSSTNSQISPALERVVRRCLEKQPAERFQSASDLAFALESLSVTTSGASTAAALHDESRPKRWSRKHLAWAAATLLLAVAALTFAVLYFSGPQNEARPASLLIPSGKLTFYNLAISPHGNLIAIGTRDEVGKPQIYLRPLDSFEIRAIAGTEGGRNPFWSPDGRFIAFFTDDKLKKVEATGGPVQIICDAGGNFGASWGRDGTILFVSRIGTGVSRVPASGGVVTEATRLDASREEYAHLMPYFLPDGRNFLFRTYGKKSGIVAGSLDTGETKSLERPGNLAGYSLTGHLLFAQGGTLFAQAYDPKTAQLSGEPVPVAEGVGVDHAMTTVFASVSETGVLAYLTTSTAMGQLTRTSQISVFDRAGKLVSTLGEPSGHFHVNVSPDGTHLAFTRERVEQQGSFVDIWTMELARGVPMRLTFDPFAALDPVWSPDGTRIAYMSDREGLYHLYVRPAGGAGEPELLLKTDADKFMGDWSADGRYILYVQDEPQTGPDDVWALPLFGDRQPFPLLKTKFNETQPSFSPDVRFIAYVSNESGRNEVYVQSFPESGFKLKISTAGGINPVWRRDGRELFYLAPDGKLMATEIRASGGAALSTGVPTPLFDTRLNGRDASSRPFAVLSNGARFVIINPVGEETASPVKIVLNWDAKLKR
jgi:serine/threonine protein kinase/Tol biopolymer transport system component